MVALREFDFAKVYEDRFLVKVSPPNSNGCELGNFAPDKDGYGQFGVCIDGQRRNLRAHRVAWILYNDRPIPKGKLIMHSCDIPLCCAEEHLILGTQQMNQEDARKKGRKASKERHGMSKLKEADIPVIKERLSRGHTLAEIGRDYGVAYVNIAYIRDEKRWN